MAIHQGCRSDESIRRQIQKAFNHLELSFDVFQNAFDEHRAEIEGQLALIPQYYSNLLAAQFETKRDIESLRDDTRRNHDDFRVFRNKARDEKRKAKRPVIRLRESMETRMDLLETGMDSLGTRMDSLEARMSNIENSLSTMEQKNDDNFAKLFAKLDSKM
ncbi:hypothetical protein Q9L58_008358 [Maublancomyces gigas]|uniref:Uncharacterized protein n=1 Tax=Discina gigas TaxID=1032678 RepID=A0ABR3GAH3_9PEZI